MKRFLLCLFLACSSLWVAGQPKSEGRDVVHGVMVGIGRTHQYDTYLSPLEYAGPQLSFLRETLRMTHLCGGRVSFQTLLDGAISSTDNPAATATDLGGRIGYDAGWNRHWQPLPNLRVMAGGMVGADVGVLYNTRNGNNPAQARLGADVSASVGGIYGFHVRRTMFTVRYQAVLPLVGCAFAPHYGQSYYELSLGDYSGNVAMVYPGNAFALRQLLTVDIPVRRYSLRVGYLSENRQSHLHKICTHDISRSFLIGVVRHFSVLNSHERDTHRFAL